MNAAVIDKIGFDDFPSGGFYDIADRVSQQVVPDMAQMQRLVGIGGRVLYHNRFIDLACFCGTVIMLQGSLVEKFKIIPGIDREIKKALKNGVFKDILKVLQQVFTDLLAGDLRRLSGNAEQGENHEGDVSLKIPFCFL